MPKVKILVVEDEKILAMQLEMKLENLGFEVIGLVSSGTEAIESVKKEQPDLILMDILLKGNMDGIEASKLILKLYDIPIIYLTAYSDDETLIRAEKTCPYGYILKPFKDNELKANIRMAIYKHKYQKANVMDFEDIYREVTMFLDEKEDLLRKGLFEGEEFAWPFHIDIGIKNIYISIDRNNKESYNAFYKLLEDIISKYTISEENEISVYPKGDELCLEFTKQ
ncbi:MAG: response regulator [Methanobacteriaceae archaeon]|jgi:CheY-like chemotaxis protein|nr:MAG: hypothetical protein CIT01_10090 [Methanobacterium sp. BRmetb2]MCC7557424.1 response regulator [Methanobacteriaceae archaeon]